MELEGRGCNEDDEENKHSKYCNFMLYFCSKKSKELFFFIGLKLKYLPKKKKKKTYSFFLVDQSDSIV